jgi:hypothetical protein
MGIESLRVDRSAFRVDSLSDDCGERAYWKSKTPQQRMEYLELLRQINFGYDSTTARLQRVLEIAELA